MKKKEKSARVPTMPTRSERERDWPTPFPTPLIDFQPQDAGRLLKLILERLEAIEKRLERIENLLSKDRRGL